MTDITDVKRRVRQRARFVCQAETHKKLIIAQYAHIIPENEGGEYAIDNLLWLCESCHRRYEASKLGEPLRSSVIAKMRAFRDTKIPDSLVDGLFDELASEQRTPPIIKIGTIQFSGVNTIFTEPSYSYKPSFLSFKKEAGQMLVSGRLKNEYGEPIIDFTEKTIRLHTKDFWDIERRARYLKIHSTTKRVWLELKQGHDLSISIEGQIFAGGELITLGNGQGWKSKVIMMNHVSFYSEGGGTALLLPASSHIYPIGHRMANTDIRQGSGTMP